MASVSTAELRILITAQDYASAQLAKTISGTQSLASKATATGAQMTRALTLPAGLLGGSILKEASDFERTLNVLVNTTRNAGDNVVDAGAGFDDAARRMGAFREEALRLGADTQIANISASDAATAMDELAKAGLSVSNTLGAARGTVLLAAAGDMEVTKAADLATAALKQFGLQGKDMESVTNMMARSTEVSRIKFADMAVGLRQGGAAMATLGVPLEGFLAILGALVDRGVSGGVAATSLRRAISAVAAPTDKAAAAMEKYNVELFDAKGTFIGFPNMIDQLNHSLGELPDKEKFAAIKDIFGQEGFKSVAPLLMAAKSGSEAFQELNAQFAEGEINAEEYDAAMTKLTQTGVSFSDQLRATEKDIKNSSAAADINKARMKGLSGAIEAINSSMETTAVVLGTPFLERLAKIGVAVADMATEFGKFMDLHPRLLEFVATFGAVVAAVGPALFFFGRFLTLLAMIATPLGIATIAIAAFAAAWDIDYQGIQQRTNNMFDAIRGGIESAGQAFHDWGVVSGDAETAVGESLSGISGLVLAFQFAMQQNWPAARKAWDEALLSFGRAADHAEIAIKNFVSEVIQSVGDLIGIDVSGITGWSEKLGALFGVDVTEITGTWNQLVVIAQSVMARISAVFGRGLDQAGGFLGIDVTQIEGNWDKIVAIAEGVWARVKAVFSQTLNTTLGLFGIDPTSIEGNWNKLIAIAQAVWVGVNAAFSRALDVAGGLFGIDVTSTEGNWTKLKEVVAAAATDIEAASARIKLAIQEIANAQLPPVTEKKSFFQSIIDAVPLLGVALKGAEATVKNFAESLSTVLDILGDLHVFEGAAAVLAIFTTALAAVSFAAATLLDVLRTVFRIVMAGADAVGSSIKGFGLLALAMKEITTGDVSKGMDFFAQAGKAFEAGSAAESKIGAEIDGFGQRIKDRLKANFKSTATDALQALFGEMPTQPATAAAEAQVAAIATTFDGLDDVLDASLSRLPATVTAALDPLPDVTSAVGAETQQALVDELNTMPANVNKATGDVITLIDDAAPAAAAAGTGLGAAIIDGISAVLSLGATTAFAEELPAGIEEAAGPSGEAGAAVGEEITASLTESTAGVADALEGIQVGISDAMAAGLEAVVSTGASITAAFQETFDAVTATVSEALTPIPPAVEAAMASALASVESSGAAIMASAQATWAAILAAVTAAMAAVVQVVESSAQQLTAAMTAAGAAIQASAQATWAAILASATAAWASIVATVQASAQDTLAAVVATGAGMTAAIQAAGVAMIGAMTSAMSGMVSAASSGVSAVIAAVSGMAGAAASAGAAIGNSIATGLSGAIQSGAARAASAAAAAVSSAIAAARAAADAHSPSRKMAALGTDMIEGLAQALAGGQSRVSDAVKIIIKEALAANIDPMIALALAKAESNFNTRAHGDSGKSIGLFQLHEAGQGAGMSAAQREDPTTNARKFLQSHSQLFASLKGQITDTTELVRRFGVEAEQPADRTGAAYAAAYQQIQQEIAAAGGSVAELANNQDAFNSALGESVDSTASLTPLMERQLALKEQMATLDVQMLAGAQSLDRINRQIDRVEGGSLKDRMAALQGNRQDNALLQQELQLKLMLAKAEASAPTDSKTGKSKGSQEIADIKAALELLGQQREEISLTSQLTKAENAARAMGLREQALLQEEALRPLQDQQFLVGQQSAQIDALNTAWQAAQATIQNQTSTENAARRDVIATMREQAGANTNIVAAGQGALQEMLQTGRITQQEFERYTAILQQFGRTAVTSTQSAATGVQTVATASGNAATAIASTGQALSTAGTEMQAVGQAGAQAGAQLATTAVQGLAAFATQAAASGNDAAISFINGVAGQVGNAFNAGYSVGTAVGQGLQAGVIESGNAAIEAAVAVANAVITAMRGPEGFDAHSPARKSYYIGQDVMDGLILGLQNPNVSDTIKRRIQQYIDQAERYRKLIPDAIDNEMRIIEVRIEQAKGLLGILDVEMRLRDAQRAAEDARKGSVADQLRLLDIDRERTELRLREIDQQHELDQSRKEIEQTERAIQEVERGTLTERLRGLAIDLQRNILKRQELVLQHDIAGYREAVELTERRIKEVETGSLADQVRALQLDQERAVLRQQELQAWDQLTSAKDAVAASERTIRDLERGSLSDRLQELALDNQKNLLSKERIQIESRLRQIHEAGIAKDLAAFSDSGLQVVDPANDLQKEVNQLHNRLAVLDDQNELLADEGELRQLNGQIASYGYRIQLEAQRDSLEMLEDQAELLDRQNAALDHETDLRENSAEIAAYGYKLQLVGQQAALAAMQKQADALDKQNQQLEYEGQLREVNADIAKYGLLVQLEMQQEAAKLLEDQRASIEEQNAALDEQTQRIEIANQLRAYAAQAQVIVLEAEHDAQQRVIDDLDRQYEALNRQKQVYDSILRVVDYLHDHLIDEGVIADPFETTPHEPSQPPESGGGSARSGGAAAGGAARAGGAIAKAGDAIGASMKNASKETDTFVGNAAAAMGRLKPVVTDAAVASAVALGTTAAEAGKVNIELGGMSSRDFHVAVDGTMIREASTSAGYLMEAAEAAVAPEYVIKIGDDDVRVSSEQAVALRESIEGVETPVSLNVNGQQVEFTAGETALLRDQLHYLNSVRTTLSVEDQAVMDAQFGITALDSSLQVLDSTSVSPEVIPAIDTAPIEEMDTNLEVERPLAVVSEVDQAGLDATLAVVEAEHILAAATAVDTEALDASLAVVEAEHILNSVTAVDTTALDETITLATTAVELPIDDVVDRTDVDAVLATAEEMHPLNAETVVVTTEMEAAVTEADLQHPLNQETIVVLSEMEAAIDEANEQHPLNQETIVVLSEMESAIDEANQQHPLNQETVVITTEMEGAILEADRDHPLNQTAVVNVDAMTTAVDTAAENHVLNMVSAVDTQTIDAAVDAAAEDHVLKMVAEVDDKAIQDAIDAAEDGATLEVEVKIDRGDFDDLLDEIKDDHEMTVKVKTEGNLPHAATGGAARQDRSMIVGEFGREMFIPWTQGYIMPHNLTERILDANKARDALEDYRPIDINVQGVKDQDSNQKTTVNNFNVNYTAMNQEKKGESDVNQVLRDMVTMLNLGGS